MKTFSTFHYPHPLSIRINTKNVCNVYRNQFLNPRCRPPPAHLLWEGGLCWCGGWGVYATPELYIHVFLDSNGFIMNVKLGILWTVFEMIVDWLIDWLYGVLRRIGNIFQSYNELIINYYHIVTMLFWSFLGFTTLVVFHENFCYFEDLLLYTSKKSTS